MPFLGWNTLADLRGRQISFLSVILYGAIGIAMLFGSAGKELLLFQSGNIYVHVAGAVFGLLLLVLSFGTGGAIGAGDALVAIVLGWYLGIYRTLLLFLLAFLLAGLLGSLLLVIKRAGRKSRLPMQPFILLAYVVLLAAEAL